MAMRYFVPELALGVLLPEETELVEKFGGLPWGLPSENWPLCKSCGKPLSHLFTLKHDAERLDLGKAGRVLMAFMCNNEPGSCETWDMDSGANAILVLDSDALENGLTEVPNGGAQTETEAFIVSWRDDKEVVPAEWEPSFYVNTADYYLSEGAYAEIFDKVYSTTKLGGLPWWVQQPECPSVPPFRFVGQFDSDFVFPAPPPSAAQAFCPVYRGGEITKKWHKELPPEGWVPPPGGPAALSVREDNTYRCEGPNYGGGGMAYLFLTTPQAPDELPQSKFLWQCT